MDTYNNLLFRWFLDLKPSERVWTPEVFSMHRRRFADHGLVQLFFDRVHRRATLAAAAHGASAAGSFLATLERRGITQQVPVPARPIRRADSPDPQKEKPLVPARRQEKE